jgi:hypothetical protein
VHEQLIAVARGDRVDAVTDELLRAAAVEGLVGLLARAALNPSRELWMQSKSLEARATSMLDELARLIAAFRDARMPLLAFKGPVVSQQLYGSAALRGFSDLDLIIAPSSADAAESLLRELGYRSMESLGERERMTNRRFAGQSLFINDAKEVLLDLHTRFSNAQFPIALSFDDAWQRRVNVHIGAHDVPTLGDIDLVVVTCSHAAKHLWHRLEFLAQIAALARRDIDWSEVDRRAMSARVARQAGLSFLLTRELLRVDVPPVPRCLALAGPSFDDVRRIVEANLASAMRRSDATGRDLFLLFDRRIDVLRSLALAALVPTHSDWQTAAVPAPLQWILRPWRLARRRLFRGRHS